MSETWEQQLVNAAQQIAVRSAGQYLNVHGLKASEPALVACLNSWVKIKLPEAMKDAKEAMECNMPQVATTTFAATMAQAGIEAAKECSMPL